MPESAPAASTRPATLALLLLFALSLLPIADGEGKYHLLEVACALAVLSIRRLGLPERAVGLPLGLLLAWSAVSIAWAPDRHGALAALLWILALGGLFSLFCARGRRALASVELTYLTVATPTMLVALAQYQGLLPHPAWANQIRMSGPFVNSNIYAAFVSIALILALARAGARHHGGGWRALAALVAAVASLNLVLTASRGGWLAAGCGIVALVVAPAAESTRWHSLADRLRPLAYAVPVVVATIIIAAQAGWLDRVGERLRGAGSYSVGHRIAIYGATLGMIRAHPFGVGLAGYPEVAPAYRVHSDRFLINFAHSDGLELVALLGIPGAAFAALALARLGRRTDLHGVVAGASPNASIAALTVLAAQSCIDFPLRQPVIGLYVAATLGVLAGSAHGRRTEFRRSILLGAIVVVAGALTLRHGEQLRAAADELAASSALPAAAALYRRADPWLLPGDPANARALGAVNARLAVAPLIGPEFLSRAQAAYAIALRRGPWSADAHLEAAVLSLAAGSPEAARSDLFAAVRLAPRDREIVLRVAGLLHQLGDRRTAVELEAAALDFEPSRPAAKRLLKSWSASGLSIEPLALAVDPHGAANAQLAAQLATAGRTAAAEFLIARGAPRWSQQP